MGTGEGTVPSGHGTNGRIGMEISVIEQIFRESKFLGTWYVDGVPDEADVNAAVDGMWGDRATFQEAVKTPQDRESKVVAAAIEEFGEVSAEVVAL